LLGLAAVLFLTPILRWIDWRCPRCGDKFALPKAHTGVAVVALMLRKLIADSRCSSCGLECGG
jgi:hypothetical protein